MIAAACLMEGLWLLSLRLRPWAHDVPLFLLLFGAIFCLYIWAILRLRRGPVSLGLVLVAAGIFRLTVFFSPPSLSDDLFRYLWDGRVQAAGINPYRYAPDHPALAFLRDAHHAAINHKSIPTLYPPLAQKVFRAAVAVSPTPTAQRATFLFFDLALMGLLPFYLRRRGLPPERAMIYAWNPLVIVEFASSGHLDSLGMFFLLAGLWAWDSDRPLWAGALWGLSFLGKLASLLLVPWLILRPKGRRALLVFGGVVVAGYSLFLTIPFLEMIPILFSGTRTYARDWSFNAGIYAAASALTQAPGLWLRLLAAGTALWIGAVAAHRHRDPLRYTGLLLALVLALSPVVHPWYVTWLVPFLCFFLHPAGLVFTGAVALSYLVLPIYQTTGVWALPAWVPWVEYLPLGALFLWERYRNTSRPVFMSEKVVK